MVAHEVSRQEGQRQEDDRGERQLPPGLFCHHLPVATNKKGTTHITSFISLEIIYKMVNILLQPRTNAVKTYINCNVDQVFHHRPIHIQACQIMLHIIEHVR